MGFDFPRAGQFVLTMLHVLRRHPFSVKAYLSRCVALTYAFPAALLSALLPSGLALDTYGEWGFLAIALVETRRLRPVWMPEALGQDFLLCGYRIFTRLGEAGSSLRGLYIVRSETDRPLMSYLGNLFTHYRYHRCHVDRESSEFSVRWGIRTPGGEADLSVTVDLGSKDACLPIGSPFPDVKTARRFSGPLPYTFDFEPETNSIISVRGTRGVWDPHPVKVAVQKPSLFDREPFRQVQPILANAFYVENVPYRWDRGRRIDIRRGQAGER